MPLDPYSASQASLVKYFIAVTDNIAFDGRPFPQGDIVNCQHKFSGLYCNGPVTVGFIKVYIVSRLQVLV